MATAKRRVAVLMGGVSRERQVSLSSGACVAAALERCGHEVVRCIVDEARIDGLAALGVEVAFVALHGTFGEDGGVQRLLEAQGVPYTGSGPAASARAFDKVEAKRAFVAAGLPTPPWLSVPSPLPSPERLAALVGALGFPCVLKPACEGSSIGLYIVRDEAEVMAAHAGLTTLGGTVLCEPFIEGRELTVAILGEVALPPVEVVPKAGLYDYDAKYGRESGTTYLVDPPLEPALREKIARTALAAHRALGCEGLSRVDIRLSPQGIPYLLEVNTIPGMTPTSLLPKAARGVGMSFEELCAQVMESAIAATGPRREVAAPRPRQDRPHEREPGRCRTV